jgi:hypothetical protein
MPWHPAANTVDGSVLNFYDVPLVGLFTQHGCSFLYQCILWELEEVSIWLYTPIVEAERAELESLTGGELTSALQRLRDGRRVTVSFASGDRTQGSEVLDVKPDVSNVTLAKLLLDALKRRVEQAEQRVLSPA